MAGTQQGGINAPFEMMTVYVWEHLKKQAGKYELNWIHYYNDGDLFAHLTFLYGSQLYHVGYLNEQGEMFQDEVTNPESVEGLAEQTGGKACFIRLRVLKDRVEVLDKGWGLTDCSDMRIPMDPDAISNDQPVELSDLELTDVGGNILQSKLEEMGYKVTFRMRWVNWMVISRNESNERVVFAVERNRREPPMRPADFDQDTSWKDEFTANHFVSMALASEHDPFDPEAKEGVPLYRGQGVHSVIVWPDAMKS
jgi:hypothetical protein